MKQCAKDHRDTNQVKALLQIDSIYTFGVIGETIKLDTVRLLWSQANQLSIALGFAPGAENANYLLARAYISKGMLPEALGMMKIVRAPTEIKLLLSIGEHFTFMPGQFKENLDSAYPFIEKAIRLSNQIKSQYWLHQSLSLLGKYYYERGELQKGKDCFLKVIHDYQRTGDKQNEAFWWSEYGIYMPDTDSTYADEVNAYGNARRLFQQLNNLDELQSVVGNLGFIYQRHGLLDSAQALYLQRINIKKSMGKTNISTNLTYVAEVCMERGYYDSSVYYSLEAIKYLDSSSQRGNAGVIYFNLAEAYRELGETEKSLQWYRKSLDNLLIQRTEYLFAVGRRISGTLIEENKVLEALNFLNDFSRQNKPPRYCDKEMLAAAFGDCYFALKDFGKAEAYYLQMMAVDSLARNQRTREIFMGQHGSILTSFDANFLIGRFYVQTGRFTTARPYLNRALLKDIYDPSLLQTRDVHSMLFRVDSSEGHYLDAIRHFSIAKALNDSVFNIAKSRQILQLQVEYDVAQRQKELQVLQANQLVQDKELQRSHQARDFTYAIAAILLVLTGIGYSRYRLKQRIYKQIEVQQKEIHQKNQMLEKLVGEKDDLLEQKEWLVKEIHHRVKNNLQIVISLLSTQSKYLDNEEAIQAIRESRHRMQAMSLIHQKLYQSENAVAVNMRTYITELSDYLKTSFDAKEIIFQTEVGAIELDLSQAIPVGLILNELITNSIKYAFTGRTAGRIQIKMISVDAKSILLEVKDDGIGLPSDIDFLSGSSMGMRLVNGLARQINASLHVEGKNGVCVQLKLKADLLKYNQKTEAGEAAVDL